MPSKLLIAAACCFVLSAIATLITGGSAGRAAFPGANALIAFTTDRTGNVEIHTMKADGSDQTNITNTPRHP